MIRHRLGSSGILALVIAAGEACADSGGATLGHAVYSGTVPDPVGDAAAVDAVADSVDDPTQPAAAAFWAAFRAQRYDQLDAVLDGLESAAEAEPGNTATAELYAIALVWKISEGAREPSQDPNALKLAALTAEQYLTSANQLAPTDPVILGRFGSLEIGIGNVLNDPARIAKGKAAIDEAVQAYPEFTLFNRARLFFDLPSGDPDAAARLDDFWKKLDVCAGESVDRTAFDIGKYLGQVTTTGPKRVCWNSEHTPHGLEGFFLYMGDALVKHGDAATAKVIYANAKKSPDIATWPFEGQLDERIANAEAWVALLADTDPMNDPVLVNGGPTACASCHAMQRTVERVAVDP